jgi:hypothetical protein
MDLHARVQRGAYRARPSRRQYIPKSDGRQRLLGVAALEDKIVQRATGFRTGPVLVLLHELKVPKPPTVMRHSKTHSTAAHTTTGESAPDRAHIRSLYRRRARDSGGIPNPS